MPCHHCCTITEENKITDLIYRAAGKEKAEKELRRVGGGHREGWIYSSISDTIFSPVYKRFNSSGPLSTVFDPAEAVIVSTSPVFVCNKVYKERKREESSSE